MRDFLVFVIGLVLIFYSHLLQGDPSDLRPQDDRERLNGKH